MTTVEEKWVHAKKAMQQAIEAFWEAGREYGYTEGDMAEELEEMVDSYTE